MVDIKRISNDVQETKKVAELQREASDIVSEMESKIIKFGKVVPVNDNEKLKPLANDTDDAVVQPFKNQAEAHLWLKENSYAGKLEGRAHTNSPDKHCLLWFMGPDGDLRYLKWVEEDYKSIMKMNELENLEIWRTRHREALKRGFHALIDRIEVDKQSK